MTRARFTSLAFGVLLGLLNGVEAKTPRTDLYGDPLPPSAVMRLGTVRLRHTHADVAFTRDGKQLISCDSEGEIRTWDVATGKRLSVKRLFVDGTTGYFENVILSRDGALAAAHGDGVALFDTKTGKKRGAIPSIDGNFRLESFSPDGRFLVLYAVFVPTETQVWDIAGIKKRQILKPPSGVELTRIHFTQDGKRLAGIASSGFGLGFDLVVRDTSTGKLLLKSEGSGNWMQQTLAFSPDGKTLAMTDDYVDGDRSGVRLFGASDLKEKEALLFPKPVYYVHELAYSPDGRWLAAACCAHSTKEQQRNENGVILWDLRKSKISRFLIARHDSFLAFAPDSKVLACRCSEGSELRLWNVATGQILHQRAGHDLPVRGLAVSPDGKTLVSGDTGSPLRLWDAASGEQLRLLNNPSHPFENLSHCLFSREGRFVISVGDPSDGSDSWERVRLWDAATGTFLRRFEINEGKFHTYAAAITADGKRLAAVVSFIKQETDEDVIWEDQIVLWEMSTGRLLSRRRYPLQSHVSRPNVSSDFKSTTHAAFTPDADLVTAWLGDRVGIEDVATGRLRTKLPPGVGAPLLFSPNGQLVAAASVRANLQSRWIEEERKGVALIEAATGEELFRLEIGAFDRIAFTPDSRGLVVADGASLRVWDTDSGEQRYRMAWPKSIRDRSGKVEVCSLSVLPNDRAVTGMTEGDILVWDLAAETWPGRPAPRDLDRKQLDALCLDLAGEPRKGRRAIQILTASPAQVLPMLRQRLQPATLDDKRIDKLLTDLDSENYSARETASRELAALCDRIEPRLRRALQDHPSLEMRRRLEDILSQLHRPSGERLATLRAIIVLETIGAAEARQILEKLSGGADAPETREAQAALQRLKHRDASARGRTSP